MAVFVNVIRSDTTTDTCCISKDISDILTLSPGKSYQLKFGACKTEIKLKTGDSNGQQAVSLSPDIFTKLAIPEKLFTGIRVLDGEIVLGPVLGVFVNPSYIKDLYNQKPRPSSLHMLKANENSHLFIYFFSIEKADWLNKKMEGCYYSKRSNAWLKKWLPLPDVVYDRGVGFSKNEKLLLEHFRDQFTPTGSITRINSRDCLDKYWLYEKLKRHGDVKPYLPETVKYDSFDDLTMMLEKYEVVYLKSFYGSRGSEVMTIASRPNDAFECSFFESDNLKQMAVQGKNELVGLINNFFKDKKFVVQQGINLLMYEGSRLDMRTLVQKNGAGHWTGVYNVVIKGKRDSLITAGEEKGARFFNFTEIMPLILNMSNNRIEELDNQLRQACIHIARAIEKEYGPFGEIGMDMALDRDLKIWFIEANSKPDRELESGIIGSARVRATCLNIIDYTRYLTGFCQDGNQFLK